VDNYEVLLRAATTLSSNSFEAVPLSGVMDTSGNALDGNNNNTVNAVSWTAGTFPSPTGDNYDWSYKLNNDIDLVPPYITKISPEVNATFVGPYDELSISFSKRMRVESFYNIQIAESPASAEPLCYTPRGYFDSQTGASYVRMEHCPFLAAATHYYYPVVDSSVQDVHFNCFYPGLGPNTNSNPAANSSLVCDSSNPTNCCGVTNAAATSLCCNGLPLSSDRAACLQTLLPP
jgi:hypothetical protein